ncbi:MULTISPECIES: hypothetical protein [unclassified Thermotoga]|uniref:hypothetical protein n=1 Tax=unclassified Thermotoga TaxID=2631113 RepID=UPI000542C53D|nr:MULTISPECIES: hypothetical protein [unclassified Thermotoga]KHC93088.1 hypothetical protein TBGT1765_03677 [Thermotoga sp. TBGT1765]KHC94496.1 hypothetical protein TBGT1766_03354 [Thermotoga sp. TBGT1766]
MRNGSILVTTVIILVIVSVLGISVFFAFNQYRENVGLTAQRLEATYRASNILSLGVACLKKHFGFSGMEINWSTGSVTWFDDFRKRVLLQSDGDAWENVFSLLDTEKYYNLSSDIDFSTEASKLGFSNFEAVAIPFENNPFFALLVVRAQVGKAVVYKYAVLSSDFLNKYAYFTEKETRPDGDKIYFITQDTIDGPFRSNDVIHVKGEPLFKASVEFKGIEVEAGNGPRYENPPPKYLTDEDIEKYKMSKIKDYYAREIEKIVKPASEAVNSVEPVGIELPAAKIVENGYFYKIQLETAYIIEFNTPRGNSENDYLIKVKYKEMYRKYVWYFNWYFVGETEGKEFNLFHIKPKPNSDLYHLVIQGNEAKKLLGLDRNEYDIYFNGVIKTDSDVYLGNMSEGRGKPMFVDGKYTIVAKNIYIEDPIIYNDYREVLETIADLEGIKGNSDQKIAEVEIRPLDENGDVKTEEYAEMIKNHESDDFLNLVSFNDVVVKEKRKNMKIFASIYAFDGSFYVEGYNSGDPKGELTIFGSLMQYVRGPVGTFHWTKNGKPEIETGYRKNYIYDWRILKGISVFGIPTIEEESMILSIREVY